MSLGFKKLTTDSLQEIVWSGACLLASDAHLQFPQLEVGNVCFDTQRTGVRPTLMSGTWVAVSFEVS